MIKRKKNEALEEQYRLQGSCCYYCKEDVPYDLITKDHFNPVSKGNTLINNKLFCCRPCNNIKGNRTIEEFRDLIIKRCCDTLKKVVAQDWKISDYQIKIIKHHVSVLKTLNDIISEDSKLPVLFT
jgi:hypothetical protein